MSTKPMSRFELKFYGYFGEEKKILSSQLGCHILNDEYVEIASRYIFR